MVALIVIVFLYAIALAAEIITQTRYTSYHTICSHMGLSFGAVASILLLLILIPICGWPLLILWGIIFVRVLGDSLNELTYQMLLNVLHMIMDHNSREQQHRLPV
ncbi:hypothetical protein ACSBR1_017247 [Camellia fascicularis]